MSAVKRFESPERGLGEVRCRRRVAPSAHVTWFLTRAAPRRVQ